MSIRSVLRHRATVRRASGQPVTWATVAEDVPVLLSVSGEQRDDPQDRTGLLLALPDEDLRAKDRVILTRGATGTFNVKPGPSRINTLHGPSHVEHAVEEVP